MSDVTSEDVESSREKVEALRAELAETNSQLTSNEDSRNNAVRKARLDQEAEDLKRELEAARSRLSVSKEEEPEEVLAGPVTPSTYPRSTGGGWYELSNGTTVQGEEAAREAQYALENPSDDGGEG